MRSGSCRSVLLRSLPVSQTVRISWRSAHAAARSIEDDHDHHESEAGPSLSFSTRADPGPQSPSRMRKGKEREHPAPIHDYQFPTSGQHGGRPDPFEILAINRSATDREIKQQCEHSYRSRAQLIRADYRLATMLHPDSAHPQSSPDHFAALNRAYSVLANEESRARYLQTGDGWSGTHEEARPHSGLESYMRAEALRRRTARRSFDNEGGQTGWKAEKEEGSSSWQGPIYTSNHRFMFGLSLVVSTASSHAPYADVAKTMVLAYGRYQQLQQSQDALRDVRDQTHFTCVRESRNRRR